MNGAYSIRDRIEWVVSNNLWARLVVATSFCSSKWFCLRSIDPSIVTQTKADAGQTADGQPERTWAWHDKLGTKWSSLTTASERCLCYRGQDRVSCVKPRMSTLGSHKYKQMLDKLLMASRRELVFDMTGVNTKRPRTKKQVGNIVAMHWLSH